MDRNIVGSSEQAKPDSEKRCYTVPEIMAILRCGKRTVYDLLKENNFRYIRLGRGAYRISKASFDAWLDQLNQE
ncbi:MAG: helix-turn-helix domain-containing protein [Oscillospiraceae bacterium]|nr:helix-turn-helix domain-containing protein [Oscillospiraceae bacterium]